ncbi:MAG: TFIIB-type zinc ribbon-containing protein [Archaeoglobaceae archaeon]
MGKVLVCPACRSSNVVMDSAGVTGKYYCKDCGYVGMAIEMTEGEYKEMLESEELSKEHGKEKTRQHDTEEHR